MGIFDRFHHAAHRSVHLIGHIADDPQVVGKRNEVKGAVMVFHIAEAAGIEFRLTMLPTTPQRRKGERVELTWTPAADGTAVVETMYSTPDPDAIRRRHDEYLRDIAAQAPGLRPERQDRERKGIRDGRS
jgi:hypothetical protein